MACQTHPEPESQQSSFTSFVFFKPPISELLPHASVTPSLFPSQAPCAFRFSEPKACARPRRFRTVYWTTFLEAFFELLASIWERFGTHFRDFSAQNRCRDASSKKKCDFQNMLACTIHKTMVFLVPVCPKCLLFGSRRRLFARPKTPPLFASLFSRKITKMTSKKEVPLK